MSLRGRAADIVARYAKPVLGVNLDSSEHDLRPGQARLMKNLIRRDGIRNRPGIKNITGASLGAFKVRGGHKFYRADGSRQRLVAYSTKISQVSDAGTETVLDSSMTADQDTHFATWSIADACYISNASDVLRKVDNTGTFSTVSGTNIPTPRMVLPFRDRLLAITDDGIERTDPRSDTVWSKNSSWATLRPDRVGKFTALHPYSFEGIRDNEVIATSALAFQPQAHYMITGDDLGADVTSATASANEDAAIIRFNDEVGTSSPYSITTVPGLGVFWFTTDYNVYWLPFNSNTGILVGSPLDSSHATKGTNRVTPSALNQVVMAYHDRFLILCLPVDGGSYPTVQYWLDTEPLRGLNGRRDIAWYGPMEGPTIGRLWKENQQGENRLIGGEGNSTTGVFVYDAYVKNQAYDIIGTTTTNIATTYQTYWKDLGRAGKRKYLRDLFLRCNDHPDTINVSIYDLTGPVIQTVAMTKETATCGAPTTSGITYGGTQTYGGPETYAQPDLAVTPRFYGYIDRDCLDFISVEVKTDSQKNYRLDDIQLFANVRQR